MAGVFGELVFERYLTGGDCAARSDGELASAFLAGMDALFACHGVETSPLLLLRLEDVLSAFLAVRRVEAEALGEEAGRGAQDAPAKARERLRKAMKDLEESCAKAGTPVDAGLADRVKPLLKQASGVLEDALKHEPSKRAVRKSGAKADGVKGRAR